MPYPPFYIISKFCCNFKAGRTIKTQKKDFLFLQNANYHHFTSFITVP